MKHMAVILTIIGSLLLAQPVSAENDNKVTICHAAGQEGTTHYIELTISENAVYKEQGGHFYENGTPRAGHEQDYLGPCQASPDTTTTTSLPESSTTSTLSPVTTTIVIESTSTLAPSTTTPIQSQPSSTTLPPVVEESSTTVVFTTLPSSTITVAVAEPPVPVNNLPETGLGTGQVWILALGSVLILCGSAALLARRKGEDASV